MRTNEKGQQLVMAKASKEDLDAAVEIHHFLDAIGRGCNDLREVCEDFELKGYEDCHSLEDYLTTAWQKGGLFRVVWGMRVLLDPRNQIVDPDLDYLALHPRFAAATADAAGQPPPPPPVCPEQPDPPPQTR